MISWPWGRSCAGKSGGLPGFPSHPVTWSTDIDESIQVSSTSFSPVNADPPHRGQGLFGLSTVGSIGRSSSEGRIISPQASQNQTGIGVANILCRDMHQSHSIDSAQFSSLASICSGDQDIFRAASRISSWWILTNHWRSERISIGVLHRQQVPTRCSSASCRERIPASSISLRMAFRQASDDIPV